MQICTSPQTDNHASIPPLSFFTGRMHILPPNQQHQSSGLCSCRQMRNTYWISIRFSSIVYTGRCDNGQHLRHGNGGMSMTDVIKAWNWWQLDRQTQTTKQKNIHRWWHQKIFHPSTLMAFSGLKLLIGQLEEYPAFRPVKIEWWGASMVICLEWGANDLRIVQLMPLLPHHLLLH